MLILSVVIALLKTSVAVWYQNCQSNSFNQSINQSINRGFT